MDTKDVVVEAAGKAFTGWVLQGRSGAALAPRAVVAGGRRRSFAGVHVAGSGGGRSAGETACVQALLRQLNIHASKS